MIEKKKMIKKKEKNMMVRVEGKLKEGVKEKDIVMEIIGEIGKEGGKGYVIEYEGEEIR